MVNYFPYLWYFSQGKQVIHPNQIKAVQEEFSPSPDRVNWATELIAAFEEHQKLGKVTSLHQHDLLDYPPPPSCILHCTLHCYVAERL